MLPLRIRFLGRDLRWGGTYPVWLLRVLRQGAGSCEKTWMDEHIVLTHGSVERVRGDLIHDIPKSLTEWTVKHNWHADRECLDISGDGGNRGRDCSDSLAGPAAQQRWHKQDVYGLSPLFLRAFRARKSVLVHNSDSKGHRLPSRPIFSLRLEVEVACCAVVACARDAVPILSESASSVPAWVSASVRGRHLPYGFS
jgi:hypothetical protein